MKIEEKYTDILQNIEYVIVNIYKSNPEMKDIQAAKAMQALTKYYRTPMVKRAAIELKNLEDIESQIFDQVVIILETRRDSTGAAPTTKRRFSRAFNTEPTADEIFVSCLRRLEKSTNLWKSKGERGYLDYIVNFLP